MQKSWAVGIGAVAGILCFFVSIGVASGAFVFERMWPVAERPWFFRYPFDVAVAEPEGILFVADSGNDRIQKFTLDGDFITSWSRFTDGSGQERRFDWPSGVAADSAGNVYVTDSYHHRVVKLDSNGQYDREWGGKDGRGSGPGEFDWPTGIAASPDGFVFVFDNNNFRIQKFDVDGTFLKQWGQKGEGDGEFGLSESTDRYGGRFQGIAVSSDGTEVFVADRGNHRIQVFSPDGTFLREFGEKVETGSPDGKFDQPSGIAVGPEGDIFVVDSFLHRVQRFDPLGNHLFSYQNWDHPEAGFGLAEGIAVDSSGFVFVADAEKDRIQVFHESDRFAISLGTGGHEEGQFFQTKGLACDENENLYVVDSGNARIQRFAVSGAAYAWGDSGTGSSQFRTPTGIARDGSGNLYVLDTENRRVQVFSPQGVFQRQWGTQGSQDGQFKWPLGIAISADGDVYVSDYDRNDVQKFDLQGNHIATWGALGKDNGQFDNPSGVAVDSLGNVYVADSANHRIQKFDSQGNYIGGWGMKGTGEGEFDWPEGVAVGPDGRVYVADKRNNRIQVFEASGEFKEKFGSPGNGQGGVSGPAYIAVYQTPGGVTRVYVSDSHNNRIQVFTDQQPTPGVNRRSIIVAGGGPELSEEPNELWDATQFCANFAHRAIIHQGFAKDQIRYLSSAVGTDLDGNGAADDIFADASNVNLRDAILALPADAEEVLIYMTDHGGDRTFRMSTEDRLDASDLDGWLDQFQATSAARVVVIYDACLAGSFVNELEPPEGKQRVVLASTGVETDQAAVFIDRGSISFSSIFFTEIERGKNIYEAFRVARFKMAGIFSQLPAIAIRGLPDANFPIGKGVDIVFGSDLPMFDPMPCSELKGGKPEKLWVENARAVDGISSIKAQITWFSGKEWNPEEPKTKSKLVVLHPTEADPRRYEAVVSEMEWQEDCEVVFEATDRSGGKKEKICSVCEAGDLDRDGAISLADAIAALRIVSGSSAAMPCPLLDADLNMDYRIGLEDALTILRRLVIE